MFENVVKITDINGNLLGTGLLLDLHVITVDHILDVNIQYYVEYADKKYSASVIFRGKNVHLDIAVLSVDILTEFKPNLIQIGKNSDIDLKGFPQGAKYEAYCKGRNIAGTVISYNYIGATNRYSYEGYFYTIQANEDVTGGFSGAPVFCEDKLAGLVARKHVDNSLQKINVIPISYFFEVENGAFCSLFGKYINGNLYVASRQFMRNSFHFQSEMIAFHGRDEQIKQLTEFCSCEHDIQWWAITGVGGIGKSRLAFEFAKMLDKNCWEWVILNSYNYNSLSKKTESIKKNILIILDYVQQNIYDIGKWLFALSQKESNYKIRILLLERYGKSYKSSKWIERLNEKNCKYDALLSILYNPENKLDPPLLELFPLENENLTLIAQNYSLRLNMTIDDLTIEKIINYLETLDPISRRPLYFIFLIDAWLSTNGNLSEWDKPFVLENILLRELHRIRLIIQNVIDDDLLIEGYLSILAYSTVLDGLKYPDEVKLVCPSGYQSIHMATIHCRKDIIRLFQQMGFISEDSDGNLMFEGLKPDLLGEFYILSNYSHQNDFEYLVRKSLAFPGRAFSFYNRFLDDYSVTESSCYPKGDIFRAALINITTFNMLDEQIYQYAKFLSERIVRDNRKHSEQCLSCLESLYAEHNSERNAVEYACGLSNMVVEYNLKKSRKIILKLKILKQTFNNSYEIAIEYAQALVSVIKRKSVRSSVGDFKNLNFLYNQSQFYDRIEMNLCYVKALSALCCKHSNVEIAVNICRKIKSVTQKFSQSEEFAYIYAKSLHSIETTSQNYIFEILSELSLLCNYATCKPFFVSYLNKIFTIYRIYWSETAFWQKIAKDVRTSLLKNIIFLVDELALNEMDLLTFFLMVSDEVFCTDNNTYCDLKSAFLEAVLKVSSNRSESLELLSQHWISFFNSATSCSITEEEGRSILALICLMEPFESIAVDDNYEILLQKWSNDILIQNYYTAYLKKKKFLSFEYVFEKLQKFYLSKFTELSKYFSREITKVAPKHLKVVVDYVTVAFFENSYKNIVALDFAKLLFRAYQVKAIKCSEVCGQFEKLKEYSDAILLWYQKTLSLIASDKLLEDADFRWVIDKQYLILRQYWSLKLAVEYCNSLANICAFVSVFEAKNYLETVLKIRGTFHKNDSRFFQKSISRINQQINASKVPSNFKKALPNEDPIVYLKDLVNTLNYSGNHVRMTQVNAVADEARALYKKFPGTEIANQLCKSLCYLSRIAPDEMLSKIAFESLMIYKQYPSVWGNFIKILSYAIPNCMPREEILNEIEEILIAKLGKCPDGKDLYKVLLSILHTKNSRKTGNPLISLPIDELFVSRSVSHTQSEIDSSLFHFHIWGTLDGPVEVINLQGRYILVNGYARWLVAKENGIDLIPVRVLTEYW